MTVYSGKITYLTMERSGVGRLDVSAEPFGATIEWPEERVADDNITFEIGLDMDVADVAKGVIALKVLETGVQKHESARNSGSPWGEDVDCETLPEGGMTIEMRFYANPNSLADWHWDLWDLPL